jgi:4-amino-4-deoxychorismate lyase
MPVNGKPRDSITLSDRGLAYGDGVFETIRIHDHKLVLLDRHLERLAAGTRRLQFPLDPSLLEQDIAQLTPDFPPRGILKIIVTRGSGGRGYAPGAASTPSRILSLHELPDYSSALPGNGINAFVCRQRLAIQPALAGIKHLNRLEQVMASLEWPDPGFMEGLMLDMNDHVVEGTRSNVFWAESGRLMTPVLTGSGVAGTLRSHIIDTLQDVVEVEDCTLARLCCADEVFFCNSINGVWPLNTLVAGDTHTDFDKLKRRFSKSCADLFDRLLANQDT